MIVVDSSALVAIFQDEADAGIFARAIEAADRLAISAVNAHETAMILRARHGPDAEARFWQYLDASSGRVEPLGRSALVCTI